MTHGARSKGSERLSASHAQNMSSTIPMTLFLGQFPALALYVQSIDTMGNAIQREAQSTWGLFCSVVRTEDCGED